MARARGGVAWSRMRRRIVVLGALAGVIVAAVLYVLHVEGTFSPSLGSQLGKVERGVRPGWYLGPQFAGLRLTDVEPGNLYRVAAFGYGECHRFGSKWNPFAAVSCGFPLLVQTWWIDGTLGPSYIPTLPDGTCSRLTLRGVPAAAGTSTVVLYTADEAIALTGPPELLRDAVSALRPAGWSGGRALPAPTSAASAALAGCTSSWDPFTPLRDRMTHFTRTSRLPLVTAGAWLRDSQLLGASMHGSTFSLDYLSCSPGNDDFDRCTETFSIVVGPSQPRLVASDLRGASCERFSVSAVPGVIWHTSTSRGDEAGIYLFTGHATISAAHDLALDSVDMGLERAVARALRPFGTTKLPAPAYDTASLLGLCARTKAMRRG